MSVVAAVLGCDSADCQNMIALLLARSLVGILHASGVLRDKLVRDLSADDLETSYAPKAGGASHLTAAFHQR